MHITVRAVPCSSITFFDPASWCSPSMFWVTTPGLTPASSNRANAWCAGLGATGWAKNSRRISQDRARTSGSVT